MASKALTFIPNWRESWKWLSMQMHIISTLIAGALLMTPHMPEEVQALLPEWARPFAIAAWLLLGIYVRLVQQGKPPCSEQE